MTRDDALQQPARPALERLGHQRVVGVGEALVRQRERAVEWQAVVVHQQPDELGDGERRVRVVQMDRHLVGQRVPAVVDLAVLGEDVAQRAGDEEVFLQQPQLTALLVRVRGVEHLRDALDAEFAFESPQVVAAVEDVDVELVGRTRRVEPQVVHGATTEATMGRSCGRPTITRKSRQSAGSPSRGRCPACP